MTAALIVVAGALIDGTGRVLTGRRPAAKAHGGLWEFPGGKVDPGEDVRTALARELREELDIAVDPAAPVPIGFAARPHGERELVLLLFAVHRWGGDPAARDHDMLAWHLPDGLDRLAMPEADRALIPAIGRYALGGALGGQAVPGP